MKRNPVNGRMLPIDLTGKVFTKLTVVSRAENINGNVWWLCQCECGNTKKIKATRLLQGCTKSCSCLKKKNDQNITHGLRKHPLYRVWRGMKYRCLSVTAKNYPDYGGRGIVICERWLNSVENFYADMIAGYENGLQLGRIDNDGPYSPDNCRWETCLLNNRNRRNTVYVTFDGRTHTPVEWSQELQIKADTIRSRILRGRSDYEALFGDKPFAVST